MNFFLRSQNILIIKLCEAQSQARSDRISTSVEETDMILCNVAEPRTGPVLHFTFML